jgi:hypothetical protein
MCSHIAGSFVSQKRYKLFNQTSEGWRIGAFVAQNRQFVIDKRVIGDMYFHR